jgi:hypothetical protein
MADHELDLSTAKLTQAEHIMQMSFEIQKMGLSINMLREIIERMMAVSETAIPHDDITSSYTERVAQLERQQEQSLAQLRAVWAQAQVAISQHRTVRHHDPFDPHPNISGEPSHGYHPDD